MDIGNKLTFLHTSPSALHMFAGHGAEAPYQLIRNVPERFGAFVHPFRSGAALDPDYPGAHSRKKPVMKSLRRQLSSPRSSSLFVLLASLSLLACKREEAEAEAPSETGEAPSAPAELKGTRVEVAVVSPSLGGLTMVVPGEVQGVRDAMLAAANGGYIEQVSVKEGDHVKKGAVLARVDSNTYSTRLVRAQVETKAAERELQRTESLGGAIPAAELDAAKDRVDTAKAALRELQVAAGRSVVTAPFEGAIVRVDAEVGEVAAPGTPLFRLVQLQPIRVSIALADRDMGLAKEGMTARVQVGARSGAFEGKIVQLSQAADLENSLV